MDNVTEQELIASSKAKGSERVTLSDVEGAIVGEYYFTAAEATKGAPQARELSLLSFCVLVLWNGFTVTGQSACADPKSFDPEIGKRLARAHAVNQIWPLMGYELKSRMARDHQLIRRSSVNQKPGQTYIGTRAVNAFPMTRGAYNAIRNWTMPSDEDANDEGYLVEYLDSIQDPPMVEDFEEYVSWFPKEVFERAYRPVRQAERSEAATAEAAGKASVRG